jgi:hypothetical protein
MKTLIGSFFLAALFVATMYFSGCQQDTPSIVTSDPSQFQPMAKPVPADAHPAWAFPSVTSSRGKTLGTVCVSDVDGTDRAFVDTCSPDGRKSWFHSWSPTGASLSYVEMLPLTTNSWYDGTAWGNYAINAVDVTVTKGVATGSHSRTIYSVTAADQLKIVSQAWCPSTTGTGAGRIAFMAHSQTQSGIFTVPATGGTPTLVYSVAQSNNRLLGNTLTWSNDGNKLAFVQYSGAAVADADIIAEIKIIDLTGTVVSTLLGVTPRRIAGLHWSHTGTNKLAFYMTEVPVPTNPDFDLYIMDATAGATPTKLVTSAYNPVWSPDNSELVYTLDGVGTYRINLATGVKTACGTLPYGDWK